MLSIYSPHISNRLKYIVQLLFEEVLDIPYNLISDKNELGDKVINYSGEKIDNSFQIHPTGLLFEKDFAQRDIPFEYRSDEFLVSVFPTEFDDLGFDVLSASFFFASRFEEYWKFDSDSHSRFQAANSISPKIGILKRPIINIWANALLKILNVKFNMNWKNATQYKVVNTLDIDNAYAIKHKGIGRTTGALAKNITSDAKVRLKTLLGKQEDPYDSYGYLKSIQDKYKFESIYFFLLGDYGGFDKNLHYKSKGLRNLILEVGEYATIGLHPSYKSYLNAEQIHIEKNRIEDITNSKVVKARKHFLKLNVPETYRNYEKIGIKEDYTMGYADQVGFRAGLCTPFTFFDLLQDKTLDIIVHPFSYMDGTLLEYLNLSIEEAKEQVSFLKKEVKRCHGEFIGVWHNETLVDHGKWSGWKEVYELSVG